MIALSLWKGVWGLGDPVSGSVMGREAEARARKLRFRKTFMLERKRKEARAG